MWMKSLFRKIVESSLEHWVITLGGIVATFFGWIFRTYLKDYLFSKHTLELLGIYWILIFLAILAVPTMLGLMFRFFKKQFVYKEEGSIKTVLKSELFRLTDSVDNLHITVDYRNWDRKLRIEKGSTKRYFKTVLSEFGIWSIENEGEDNLLIVRDIPEAQLFTE
jgi:hypothetical protein